MYNLHSLFYVNISMGAKVTGNSKCLQAVMISIPVIYRFRLAT